MEDLERERIYGVYMHKKNGTFAVARKSEKSDNAFVIDKNKKHKTIFGVKVNLVESGTGNWFFNKSLRNYEYLSEL